MQPLAHRGMPAIFGSRSLAVRASEMEDPYVPLSFTSRSFLWTVQWQREGAKKSNVLMVAVGDGGFNMGCRHWEIEGVSKNQQSRLDEHTYDSAKNTELG